MTAPNTFDLVYGDEDDNTVTESYATARLALDRARALHDWVDIWYGPDFCCKVARSGDVIELHPTNGWRVREVAGL